MLNKHHYPAMGFRFYIHIIISTFTVPMADVFTPKVRSFVMSRIRKTNTRPELLVRSYLFRCGHRYRLYYGNLAGRPDLVFVQDRIAVFVNGCFWHGHSGCKLYRPPKSNKSYWGPKIQGNILRDKENQKTLRRLGWRTITVWECELSPKKAEATLRKLDSKINKLKAQNPL